MGFGILGFGHSGSSPSPFDALDGHRLAGPQGSHPLHNVTAEMLLRSASGPVEGVIALATPAVRVGETVDGRIRIGSAAGLEARGGSFRMVGLRLLEERKSRTISSGRQTHTESWVEANGSLFATETFGETPIPVRLEPGATWETAFTVPAPPLGPPSAHLGEAIVAWALEVRWDVPWHADALIATLLQVDQHPDLLRAGVGRQGGESLLDEVDVDGATIAVTSGLPARGGAPLEVAASWPAAPDGRSGRIELHRRTTCPNGEEGIVAVAPVEIGALRGGTARAVLALPDGIAPSFDGAGLEVAYVLRVLVDRAFRSDAAVERPVGIA